MRVYLDTEFIENGKTITLISIGLVREDGATYYAVNAKMPIDRIRGHEWLMANVVPSLPQVHGDRRNQVPKHWLFDYHHPDVKYRSTIAAEIVEFVGEAPEFWAWYADYDWVVLCQLYGTMMDLPEGWPMYCRDFKQEADRRYLKLEQSDSKHNALGDAQWLADQMRQWGAW